MLDTDKINGMQVQLFDCYNQSVYDDICCTITTSIYSGNNHFVVIPANDNENSKEKQTNKNNMEELKEQKECKYRIRKLTPRECFRLMDVDDKDIDKIQEAGISKIQQYKMAGNSITIAPLYFIFENLFINDEKEYFAKPNTQLTLF